MKVQVGDLVEVYTGVGESDLALAIVTQVEPILKYDGSVIVWVTFVKENPYGTAKNSFKFSSHYFKPIGDQQ